MKYIITITIILFFTLIYSCESFAQSTYTLEEIRNVVQQNSFSTFQAGTKKNKAGLSYKLYKSQLKPQVNFSASIPNFIKSSRETFQPDGTISFQSVSQNNSYFSISALQDISYTGGQIFAMSNIQRFDNFNTDSTLYNGTPFRIGINQPIFGYNPYKYQKKIQPLLLEESMKDYNIEVENALYDATLLYFDVIIASEDKKIAQLNNDNNNNLIKITNERYILGKVSKDEKLQLEIELQNASLNYSKATMAYQQSHYALQTEIGNDSLEDSIQYLAPQPMSNIEIDIPLAIQESLKNRPEFIRFQRQQIQAKDNLAQKKHEYGIQTNLTASYGLARGANNLRDIYTNPLNEQQVMLSVSVPILDWGKKKSVLKIAKLELEEAERKNIQEEIALKNNVKSIAFRFLQLQSELKLQISVLEKTIERSSISNQRYILGDISTSDLTLAQRDNNQAQRNYMLTLRNYWLTYYQLRIVSGYDFLTQKPIIYN